MTTNTDTTAASGAASQPDLQTVVKYLCGEGPLCGVWFGDGVPAGENGSFWWRRYLRAALAAPAAQEAEPAGYRISDPEEPEIGSWFSETPARAKYGLVSEPLYAHPPRPQAAAQEAEPTTIDMVLHCPACGLQHIDAPDERTPGWKNEPHRSHLCHGCGHIWRPADVPTNGVAAVQTKGKADSPIAARAPRPQADAQEAEPATQREFANELGNRIRIVIEGPTSVSENVLTPNEVAQLRCALNDHATRQRAYADAPTTHPDDIAVDRFAAAMKSKLAAARAKGRGGWETNECTQDRLSQMLREHVEKGDPRDVANFCAFLWNRGESIATSAPRPQADAVGLLRNMREWYGVHATLHYSPLLAQVDALLAAAPQAPAAGAAPTDAEIDAVTKAELGEMRGFPLEQQRRVIRAVLARWGAAAPAQEAAPLTHAELQEVKRAADDIEDCGETDVDYDLLVRAAMAGYLECTRFQVLDQSALDRAAARARQEGGAAC